MTSTQSAAKQEDFVTPSPPRDSDRLPYASFNPNCLPWDHEYHKLKTCSLAQGGYYQSYFCIPHLNYQPYSEVIEAIIPTMNTTTSNPYWAVIEVPELPEKDRGLWLGDHWTCLNGDLWVKYGAAKVWHKTVPDTIKDTVFTVNLEPCSVEKLAPLYNQKEWCDFSQNMEAMREADRMKNYSKPRGGLGKRQHHHGGVVIVELGPGESPPPDYDGPPPLKMEGASHRGPCGPGCGCQRHQAPVFITTTKFVPGPPQCGCGHCGKAGSGGHAVVPRQEKAHEGPCGPGCGCNKEIQVITQHDTIHETHTETEIERETVTEKIPIPLKEMATTTVFECFHEHCDSPKCPACPAITPPPPKEIVQTKVQTIIPPAPPASTISVFITTTKIIGNPITVTSIELKTLAPETITRTTTEKKTEMKTVQVTQTQVQHHQESAVVETTTVLATTTAGEKVAATTITSYVRVEQPAVQTVTVTVTATSGAERARGVPSGRHVGAMTVGTVVFWLVWDYVVWRNVIG